MVLEFAELYDINILGTFSFKGTTLLPRFGNPTPRIAEGTGGMLNSVGLQNPGVEKVISEELPKLKQVFHKPVMANVSGFSIDELIKMVSSPGGTTLAGLDQLYAGDLTGTVQKCCESCTARAYELSGGQCPLPIRFAP